MRILIQFFTDISIRNKLISIFSIIFVVGFFINFMVASDKLRSESYSYIVS